MSRYDERERDAVAANLNGRPRKTLGWRTPAEALNGLISASRQLRESFRVSLTVRASSSELAPKAAYISTGSAKFFMTLLNPFMLVLGGPWFDTKKKATFEMLLPLIHPHVYLALGVAVFYFGYYFFLQGPLAIIEHVMFPVMAHFLSLGKTIAKHSKNL